MSLNRSRVQPDARWRRAGDGSSRWIAEGREAGMEVLSISAPDLCHTAAGEMETTPPRLARPGSLNRQSHGPVGGPPLSDGKPGPASA
jgi:hypothetical protein